MHREGLKGQRGNITKFCGVCEIGDWIELPLQQTVGTDDPANTRHPPALGKFLVFAGEALDRPWSEILWHSEKQ